jgi:hypothetical protein
LKVNRRSSIQDVAGVVAEALARAGVRAVLSGGACASLHSGGVYQSVDLDFILQEYESAEQIDEAMRSVGFTRTGNQYFHPEARFYVEFPPGPLSIAGDYKIEPVEIRIGARSVLGLSATDSCRDRLAAFFHWNDQPGLQAAVQIALRSKVDLERIREWSEGQGASARFQAFLEEIERVRRRRSARKHERKK